MRVEGKCIGDCSKCQLLANGEVDMIPCILDQIFIRTRKIEKENAFIRRSLDSMMQDRNMHKDWTGKMLYHVLQYYLYMVPISLL
jgi:hypothetical protein